MCDNVKNYMKSKINIRTTKANTHNYVYNVFLHKMPKLKLQIRIIYIKIKGATDFKLLFMQNTSIILYFRDHIQLLCDGT